MRKYLIMITSVLVVLLLFVVVCVYYTFKINSVQTESIDYTEQILSSSSWIEFTQHDIDLLVNDNYTDNVNAVIKSLENGIPVILYVEGGFLDTQNNGNYVTASYFDTNGNIVVYYKTDDGFLKISNDFYMVMESAKAAFVMTEGEILS